MGEKVLTEFLTNFITKHVTKVGDKLFTKFGEDIGEPLHFYHGGRQVNFRMSLHKVPVSRLCREGVEIIAGNPDLLLNIKEEFLQGAVPSTRTQRGFGK